MADQVIHSLAASLTYAEDKQITKIGNYIEERPAFKARRVGQIVQIFSYVHVATQVPANTQFADTGFSNAEGIYLFIQEDGTQPTIVSCTGGHLLATTIMKTGYYNVVGSAVAPIISV